MVEDAIKYMVTFEGFVIFLMTLYMTERFRKNNFISFYYLTFALILSIILLTPEVIYLDDSNIRGKGLALFALITSEFLSYMFNDGSLPSIFKFGVIQAMNFSMPISLLFILIFSKKQNTIKNIFSFSLKDFLFIFLSLVIINIVNYLSSFISYFENDTMELFILKKNSLNLWNIISNIILIPSIYISLSLIYDKNKVSMFIFTLSTLVMTVIFSSPTYIYVIFAILMMIILVKFNKYKIIFLRVIVFSLLINYIISLVLLNFK